MHTAILPTLSLSAFCVVVPKGKHWEIDLELWFSEYQRRKAWDIRKALAEDRNSCTMTQNNFTKNPERPIGKRVSVGRDRTQGDLKTNRV